MDLTGTPLDRIAIGDPVWVTQGKTDHMAVFLGKPRKTIVNDYSDKEDDSTEELREEYEAMIRWVTTGKTDHVTASSIRPMDQGLRRRRQGVNHYIAAPSKRQTRGSTKQNHVVQGNNAAVSSSASLTSLRKTKDTTEGSSHTICRGSRWEWETPETKKKARASRPTKNKKSVKLLPENLGKGKPRCWAEAYSMLLEFSRKNNEGDNIKCDVPPNHPLLGEFVTDIRSEYADFRRRIVEQQGGDKTQKDEDQKCDSHSTKDLTRLSLKRMIQLQNISFRWRTATKSCDPSSDATEEETAIGKQVAIDSNDGEISVSSLDDSLHTDSDRRNGGVATKQRTRDMGEKHSIVHDLILCTSAKSKKKRARNSRCQERRITSVLGDGTFNRSSRLTPDGMKWDKSRDDCVPQHVDSKDRENASEAPKKKKIRERVPSNNSGISTLKLARSGNSGISTDKRDPDDSLAPSEESEPRGRKRKSESVSLSSSEDATIVQASEDELFQYSSYILRTSLLPKYRKRRHGRTIYQCQSAQARTKSNPSGIIKHAINMSNWQKIEKLMRPSTSQRKMGIFPSPSVAKNTYGNDEVVLV